MNWLRAFVWLNCLILLVGSWAFVTGVIMSTRDVTLGGLTAIVGAGWGLIGSYLWHQNTSNGR